MSFWEFERFLQVFAHDLIKIWSWIHHRSLIELLDKVEQLPKWLWRPIRAIREESRHRKVIFVSMGIELLDFTNYFLFFLRVDLLAAPLIVLADHLSPKDEHERAIVAHPALVFVVISLHSPLATSWYEIFKPHSSLN